jgi:hypothetical protein
MLPNRGVRKNPGWSDYVRGEWWISVDGDAEYADQDIGAGGHEQLALDSMIDADELLSGLLEEELIDQKEADEVLADRLAGAHILALYNIPDEIAVRAIRENPSGASSTEIWAAIKKDARVAYARYWGAIMGINREFAAWEFGDKQIKAVQDFIFEQACGEELEPDDTQMCLEEIKTQRYECFPFDEFIVAKRARTLWTSK